MDLLKSRRRFLMQLAAVGAMVPLSGSGLAQFLLGSEKGTARLKVVFFMIPDGLAVDAYSGAEHNGNGLWFPRAQGEDTTSFELNEVSQELAAYRSQALYLQGLILATGTGGHNGWMYALRDSQGSMSSIDRVLGDALPGNQPGM